MREIPLASQVTALVSGRRDGDIDKKTAGSGPARKNLTKLLAGFSQTPADLVQMEQLHGTKVSRVGRRQRGKIIPGADGLITDQRGVILLLRTADCLPVFLFDPDHLAIGLLHCGWRGAVGKIFLEALIRMQTEFSTRSAELQVVFGPSLKVCCNQVKAPVFQQSLPEWGDFLHWEKAGTCRVDLDGFVRQTAITSGVPRKNIRMISDCTYENSDYFSYRRSLAGNLAPARFASLLWLN